MAYSALPAALDTAFSTHTEPEALFADLLPALCDVLQTDRCFLDVRNPQTRAYRCFCWRRSPEFPDKQTPGWEHEQHWEDHDPLFAAALRNAPSIFVDDIETADPTVLNREFERKYFGHRALIHAHLCQDDQLWGILQPCIFGHPRLWSDADRLTIAQVTERLTPIVIDYVRAVGV
jgi:GAF domain-containing protein